MKRDPLENTQRLYPIAEAQESSHDGVSFWNALALIPITGGPYA